MKQFLDFLPLVVFFAFYKIYDIYAATAALIVATAIVLIYSWVRFRKVEKMALITFVLVNRPGFPGECFICELRLPDHRFRWKHNKLFLLLPEEYGPAFPAIVDCYTSPPT
ncbi:intracellular septation protein A [Shigella sonnei]|nr:intracellular septation protein A [Shigella sonnei]